MRLLDVRCSATIFPTRRAPRAPAAVAAHVPAVSDKCAEALKAAAQRIKLRLTPVSEPAPEIMPSEIIETRAERVRALVEGNFGSILERKGDVMIVEVPADPSNQTLAAANEAKASADNRLARRLQLRRPSLRLRRH